MKSLILMVLTVFSSLNFAQAAETDGKSYPTPNIWIDCGGVSAGYVLSGRGGYCKGTKGIAGQEYAYIDVANKNYLVGIVGLGAMVGGSLDGFSLQCTSNAPNPNFANDFVGFYPGAKVAAGAVGDIGVGYFSTRTARCTLQSGGFGLGLDLSAAVLYIREI